MEQVHEIPYSLSNKLSTVCSTFLKVIQIYEGIFGIILTWLEACGGNICHAGDAMDIGIVYQWYRWYYVQVIHMVPV